MSSLKQFKRWLSKRFHKTPEKPAIKTYHTELKSKPKVPKPAVRSRYKPAFTCGFRGWPRTFRPLGSIPAPTLDQVRRLEQEAGQKLKVMDGKVYYRNDKPFPGYPAATK
jgi:hypothetical protein